MSLLLALSFFVTLNMPKPPPSRLADQHEMFATAEQAAIAGLRGINEKHVETGGGILFNPDTGKYAYTTPVGQLDDAHFRAAVQIPPGWVLKGIFHTHPQGPQSTLFSQDDVYAAQQLKVPSYILPRYDDKIRLFDPSAMQASKSAGSYFSPGSLVDETPDKPVLPPPPKGPPDLSPLAGAVAPSNPMASLVK